jgi:signal transduction histidine kinase/HAMP domain-containing protein
MLSQWSIRRKLVTIVIVIASLIVLATSIITLQTSAGIIRGEQLEQKRIETVGYARLLDAQLRNLARTPQALADILNDSASDSTPMIARIVSSTLRDQNMVERIVILRPAADGFEETAFARPIDNSILASRTDRVLPALPDELWVEQSLQIDGTRWSQSVNANQRIDYYVASTPYLPLGASQKGVVWIELNPERFRALVQDTLQPVVGQTYHLLVDGERLIGAFGLPMEMADRTGAPLMLQAELQEALAQFAQMPSDGEWLETTDPLGIETTAPALILRSTLPGSDWSLVSVYEQAALQAPQNQAAFFALLIALGGLITLGIIVRNTINSLVSDPLDRIAEAAAEIGSGDMRYHIGYTSRSDEVGSLARALASMQNNLYDTYGRMSEYGRTLETRVADRTQELSVAREQAQNTASELRMLYDASIDIVSEYQLDVMLQKLVNYVRTLLRAGYCSVWLLNEDGRQLRLVATTNDQRHVVGVVVPSNEGLAGRVVRTRKPLMVDDYTNWSGRIGWIMPQMHRAVAVPLLYGGKPIGAIIAGRGPLDRKFVEDDQRLLTLLANVVSPIIRNAQLFMQLEEAKKNTDLANEVKTRFLASITHELRTPLNLIINNMDFMRVGVFGEVNDEQHSRLDQTIRSAEDLLYLINDLLDVSKIEAGEMQVFIQPTDPYPLLVDTLDAALALIPEGSQVPLLTAFPETLPQLPMDARRIRQVLLNLLGNAIKFTRQGEINFRVRVINDRLEFSVSDTGMGIPKEEIEMIFRPFERARGAKHNAIEGTGLGLAISRFLVEAHNGMLEVETEVGKGSTFRFSLPINPPESQRTLTVKATSVVTG